MENRHICASCDHCSLGGTYCHLYQHETCLDGSCKQHTKITTKKQMRTYKEVKLTAEERYKLKTMLECGYTWNEIASAFGENIPRITRCAHRYGFAKPKTWTTELKEDIRRRLSDGQLPRHIAKELNLDRCRLNGIIRYYHLHD